MQTTVKRPEVTEAYYTVKDVMVILGCKATKAQDVIRQLNDELEALPQRTRQQEILRREILFNIKGGREEMSYYRECPICGSNLDPGEQCTCAEDRRKEAERKQKLYQIGAYGQIMFNFSREEQSYEKTVV